MGRGLLLWFKRAPLHLGIAAGCAAPVAVANYQWVLVEGWPGLRFFEREPSYWTFAGQLISEMPLLVWGVPATSFWIHFLVAQRVVSLPSNRPPGVARQRTAREIVRPIGFMVGYLVVRVVAILAILTSESQFGIVVYGLVECALVTPFFVAIPALLLHRTHPLRRSVALVRRKAARIFAVLASLVTLRLLLFIALQSESSPEVEGHIYWVHQSWLAADVVFASLSGVWATLIYVDLDRYVGGLDTADVAESF